MRNYRIIMQDRNGEIKSTYYKRSKINYDRIVENVPPQLIKISENNKSIVENLGLNKLELKISIK